MRTPRLTRHVRALPLAAALALVAACGSTAATTAGTTTGTTSATATDTGTTTAAVATDNAPDHDDAADHEWDAASEVAVTLDGDTASSDSGAVVVDGSTVTITAAGTYRLSGSLTDGQVVVQTTDAGIVRLVLDGVEITSSTSSPLVVTEAEEVMVVLADGTTSTLTDAAEYVYADGSDEPNAALFSNADLTIAGDGALVVTGSSNDGIASKDGLVVTGGTITVDAVDDGIRGKDYVVVEGGEITVTAGGDGVKSDNADDATMGYVQVSAGALSVDAGGDGVDAETDVIVAGGSLDVTAGGGHTASVAADASAKGLKGTVSVVVAGGGVRVDAADDALHSNATIDVSGGELTLASGDDGAHADAALTISGGSLTVTDSYEGLESAVIAIADGSVDITASDDGLNAGGGADGSGTTTQQSTDTGRGGPMGGGGDQFADDGSWIYLHGGTVVVDAGGDGLDSNGSIEMTGGTVVVAGPTEQMNGALDVNGTFSVTGGTLIAVGSAGMAEEPDAGGQAVLNVRFGSTQGEGTVVQVVSGDGEVVATWTAPKSFQSLVLTSPDLVAGESYEVQVGGAASGETVGWFTAEGDAAGSSLGSVAAG